MLRRIVSLGQQGPEVESQELPMTPSPGDGSQSPDHKATGGGLASVFKGLAGSKLTKSPPAPLSTANFPNLADYNDATSATARGLRPGHMDSFELLRTGTPAERVAAANTLRYAIAEYPLNPVLDIWYAAKDLIEPSKPIASRVAGWELLTECVKHTSSTDLERNEYFQTLSAPSNHEDFHHQLTALVDLTNHGRDLSGFEYNLLPLLTSWLQQAYNSVKAARKQASRVASKSLKGKAVATGEEQNFSLLFSFVLEVIKFNFKVADDYVIGDLINVLLYICMNASVEDNLRSCIDVMDAIVTFGAIPNHKLKDCVQILSSIHSLVPNLAKDAWHTLSNFCKSHNGQATVRILLDVLRNCAAEGGKESDVVREVRGSLSVLRKLLWKSSEKGYPSVPFTLLNDGLSAVVKTVTTPRIHALVLRVINSMLDDGDRRVNPLIQDEDWSHLFEVAAVCAKRAALACGGNFEDGSRSLSAKDDNDKLDDDISKEFWRLIARLEELLKERRSDFMQRHECICFFTKVHHALPDSAAAFVLDYFNEFRCCFPSDIEWEGNLALVLNSFYANRTRSSLIRLQALKTITEAYEMMELVEDQLDEDTVEDFTKAVIGHVVNESDTLVLQDMVSFAVSVAAVADTDLFDFVMETFGEVVEADRDQFPIISPTSPTSAHVRGPGIAGYYANQSPLNVVTRGYVQIFMRSIDTDNLKSTKAFTALVTVAKSSLCATDARLTAMKLLFRLRADWANRIFLVSDTESQALAGTLYRTEASLAKKLAEEAAQPSRLSRTEQAGSSRSSRGISFGHGSAHERGLPSRTSSGARVPSNNYHQLWTLPDGEALPEIPGASASPVLLSQITSASDATDAAVDLVALNMAAWLDALTSMFQQGHDWEVYSFILVHLPSQLSNHGVFRGAVPQIQELRKIICEQIRMNSFQEPPAPSGLRRADIANCLLHTLTMLLSYHNHFQKNDEDEIVRTFMQGMSDRTAKCCIHALSICCHELPLSTSKSLVTILQKMAQIITQPNVAMHILEFLACLSRLPTLFGNFREEEFRIVFGICFRYLQSVRDKKTSSRTSHLIEGFNPGTGISTDSIGQQTASDDLPQYVYALAYHVITFWFLAIRLPDRPSHVGWIVKNLFADGENGQGLEEQAQITIDFMQRVAFADVGESTDDVLFTEDKFGEMIEKRWIVGNSIVTIKQSSATGWAQITKRQPSGTCSYAIRESVRPPPPHQDRSLTDDNREGQNNDSLNNVLPSHLLVQLIASVPQTLDINLRPIPLPDEETVERAIRLFDRSSTVDGHKVGVIYIGENQKDEASILANVSGSGDYIQFLNGLGTLTKLTGATFNTQGLDREYESDGQYTFCWRDRVTEIVFHVTTQMPTNLDHDPQCINKKRHIGNDFVNIIFNDSGLPFEFDTFRSEFNYVNIVITPESRASFVASREAAGQDAFYKVQVLSKPGFPEISPASQAKMVSLKALPDFIRLLAVNASVFSLVWLNRAGGEHVSSWCNRLREINRLRDKYGPKLATPTPPSTSLGVGAAASVAAAGAGAGAQGAQQLQDGRPMSSVSFSSLRRSSVATFFTSTSEQTSHRSSMLSTGTNETEIMPIQGVDVPTLVDSLDFSKWA